MSLTFPKASIYTLCLEMSHHRTCERTRSSQGHCHCWAEAPRAPQTAWPGAPPGGAPAPPPTSASLTPGGPHLLSAELTGSQQGCSYSCFYHQNLMSTGSTFFLPEEVQAKIQSLKSNNEKHGLAFIGMLLSMHVCIRYKSPTSHAVINDQFHALVIDFSPRENLEGQAS